jgi:endonuclease/exonuclease/phosphatase family metal-dependent hydrolase
MKLITWNVQWCRGMDGRVDPSRIVAEARRLADFDVLCLQEIADNFPDPLLEASAGEDQFAQLAGLLPGYTPVEAIGADLPAHGSGRRRRFGNLILSRLPVRQVWRRPLPFPAEEGVKGMQRVAVEAVVGAEGGDIRVLTTHLEYYSANARAAQVEALRAIYAEGHGHAREGAGVDSDEGPYRLFRRPEAMIITGDFNLEPDDPLHARMRSPFADGTPPLLDAWQVAHPGVPHASTFNIYRRTDPRDHELRCDFIFVSEGLAPRVRAVSVDRDTQASDHQPVLIELD